MIHEFIKIQFIKEFIPDFEGMISQKRNHVPYFTKQYYGS